MNTLNTSTVLVFPPSSSEQTTRGLYGFPPRVMEKNYLASETDSPEFFTLSVLYSKILDEFRPPETYFYCEETYDISEELFNKPSISGSDYHQRSVDVFSTFPESSAGIKPFADLEKTIRELLFLSIVSQVNSLGFPKSARRLSFLHNYDASEDGKEQLTLESAQGFLSFISNFQYLGEPGLGLFSEGTLSVGWRIADDKHLLVEPLKNGEFSYALIVPSKFPGNKSRHNGRGSIDDVINVLKKIGVDKWKN